MHGSRGTGGRGPADSAVLLGLLAGFAVDRLLVTVHGGGGRAEVHVVEVVEVGRPGHATVGLVTVGGGSLDDRTAAHHGADSAARKRGRGRARGHGEVAVGRGADGRSVTADRRRVTAVRI